MARQIVVITPESIPLQMELAGIGSRSLALGVDLMIQAFVVLALTIALIIVFQGQTITLNPLLIGLIAVLFFLVFSGYFIAFELLWNGQSPGKRLLGLRVVDDAGRPVTAFQSAARNLVRVVDILPGTYLFGALSVFLQKEHKRLGDLVAGTMVIKERHGASLVWSGRDRLAARPEIRLAETVNPPSQVLTPAECELLRRFDSRRSELAPAAAEELAWRILAPLALRLNLRVNPGEKPRYAEMASLLVREMEDQSPNTSGDTVK